MASYHVSNFGSFGGNIPADEDGFTHTSVQGWLHAPVDWGYPDPGYAWKKEWAREAAAKARDEIASAERAIEQWRRER